MNGTINGPVDDLWWISWEQKASVPPGGGEPVLDSRPVQWPPPATILMYWETGLGDGHTTVVALCCSKTLIGAKRAIRAGWDPGVGPWRFARPYGKDNPPGDRFPPPKKGTPFYERWPWR